MTLIGIIMSQIVTTIGIAGAIALVYCLKVAE